MQGWTCLDMVSGMCLSIYFLLVLLLSLVNYYKVNKDIKEHTMKVKLV